MNNVDKNEGPLWPR